MLPYFHRGHFDHHYILLVGVHLSVVWAVQERCTVQWNRVSMLIVVHIDIVRSSMSIAVSWVRSVDIDLCQDRILVQVIPASLSEGPSKKSLLLFSALFVKIYIFLWFNLLIIHTLIWLAHRSSVLFLYYWMFCNLTCHSPLTYTHS